MALVQADLHLFLENSKEVNLMDTFLTILK